MAYFETLEELGEYVERTGKTIEVVDAPVALSEWSDQLTYGPAWKNQPSVRKVVGFIARQLASTPLHLFERDQKNDRQRVRDGALAEMLLRPSRAPGVTPYRLWEALLIDGLLHDKWCAKINEHMDGGFSLTRIPARRVKFKSDWLGQIQKIAITDDQGNEVQHDPAGYLIDVGYSERGANGTSPLRTLQNILDEYREAIEYRRQVWKNGARVPQVIERPAAAGKFEDGAFTRFKNSWQAFVKGGGQEGGTPILEDGMQLKAVDSFKPSDTLDLDGRKLTDIEVASAYYIAPELVGAREGTFANIKAFKEMLYGPNLGPYYDAWQQALNATLVPLIEPSRPVYIEAAIESKMRGSFEEQIKWLSTAVGAPVMTRNEARPRLNLSQVDGGDELVTPLNVLLGGQTSPQDGVTGGRGGGSLSAAMPADELLKLVTAAGALIRAGFDAEASLAAVGLDPIEHTGLLPVTIREDEKAIDAVLAKFKERQRQVVASQKAAGVHDWWDRDRWDRELTDDLTKAGAPQPAALAALFNDQVERELLTGGSSDAHEDA